MRTLFIILLFAFPLSLGAVTGQDVRWDWELGEPAVTADATSACSDTAVARFDWVLGEPAVTVDPTNACSDTAVARFDWVLGEPSVVFDATATCTAGAPAAAENKQDIFWFD